jgi:S-formylglutathione hydrolase
MRLHVFLPPLAAKQKCPTLYALSGLTCDDTHFVTKAGAQRCAAAYGLILVMPDTSPRNTGTPGEDDHVLLGSGASYYVDATKEPWREHYQMYTYITAELPRLVERELPALPGVCSIMGHSMVRFCRARTCRMS